MVFVSILVSGINLLRGRKSAIFAQQGRLVASINVKFGMAEGHVGPLGRVKFHTNWCMEWVRTPKMENFHTHTHIHTHTHTYTYTYTHTHTHTHTHTLLNR